MSNQKLKINEASLEFVLNFILENLKEDREMALEHHANLTRLMNRGIGGDEATALEIDIAVQELSGALIGFLNSASMTTDRAIKIAKILGDLLIKMDIEETLTDSDRANIVESFQREQDEAEKAKNIIAIGDHNA